MEKEVSLFLVLDSTMFMAREKPPLTPAAEPKNKLVTAINPCRLIGKVNEKMRMRELWQYG